MKTIKISTLAVIVVMLAATSLMAQGVTLPGDFHKAYICGVITYNGSPVSGVQVTAVSKEGGMAYANNAANGNYSLGVGEGEWTILAAKDGYFTPKRLNVNVRAEEEKNNINIQLQKSVAFIKGTVVDESNKPIPNAFVTAMPNMLDRQNGNDDEDVSAPEMGGQSFFSTTCDKQGNFKLQTMKGNYMLMASAPGYQMSRKNPAPNIPGMENVPEQYRSQMPVMGIEVTVAEGETKDGVIIILSPVKNQKELMEKYQKGYSEKPEAVKPMPNILVGKPMLTPNNVLHWTRTNKSEESAFYVVVRSTAAFGSKTPKEVVTFKFPNFRYGFPKSGYYSFTDNSAIPGKSYWYAVYEVGTSGAGPYSNSVSITTK